MRMMNRTGSVPHRYHQERAGLALVIGLTLAQLSAPALAQQPAPPAPATATPAPAPSPPDYSKVEIKTTNLGQGLFMLEGQGGNITVAVGRRAVLMVDGQFAPLHDKIRAAIRQLSRTNIRYLVNTHFHGDHTGGNAAFARGGVTVVAHENVKKRLAAGTVNGLNGNKTAPAAAGALPSRTYNRALSLKLGGVVAHLNYVANAHTDGDTYVWFKVPNVLATGDTFTNGRYPNIDFANGGTIKGMIDAVDIYLDLANDQTKIVPGHGPLATKADLVAYRALLVTARDRIAGLVKDGKTESDVIAARPLAEFDGKWAATDQAAVNFIRVVYRSLSDAKTG